MSTIQIRSASKPFSNPGAARSAAAVIGQADAMGLLPEDLEIERLDWDSFTRVAARISEAGIGRRPIERLEALRPVDPETLVGLLREIIDSLEESPVPETEWSFLSELFGVEALAELLGISAVSLRRYRSGSRATPDRIAARLHWVARAVAALAGVYNEIGIRRWFHRRRTALDGATPVELLGRDWSPEDPSAIRVLELARSISGSPAT